MGIRQARIELETGVSLSMRAKMIAHLGNALMRRAHERSYAFRIGVVKNLDDRPDVLKAHRLGARFFFRHVIHAEELVVTKENSIHGIVRTLCLTGSHAIEE